MALCVRVGADRGITNTERFRRSGRRKTTTVPSVVDLRRSAASTVFLVIKIPALRRKLGLMILICTCFIVRTPASSFSSNSNHHSLYHPPHTKNLLHSLLADRTLVENRIRALALLLSTQKSPDFLRPQLSRHRKTSPTSIRRCQIRIRLRSSFIGKQPRSLPGYTVSPSQVEEYFYSCFRTTI